MFIFKTILRTGVIAGLAVGALAGTLLAGCAVPAPAPAPVEPSPIHRTAAREHTVVRGETISSIARLHEVTVASILRANPAVEPERLRVGTVLEIPVRKPVIRRVQSLSPAGEEVGP